MPRLILASASPRRRQLLGALGVEFDAFSPQVEEVAEGGPPERLVLANARAKATAGLARARQGDLVLGADTDVVLDGRILGKPAGEAQARAHLEALAGRTHEVLSALVLLGPVAARAEATERSGLERTEVRFRELDEELAAAYLASGEWRDRAGGYAVQGLGSMLVEAIDGDLSNVIGMPVPLFWQLVSGIVPKP